MNFWDFATIVFVSVILVVAGGFFVAYKLLEVFTDIVKGLERFAGLFSKALPRLSGPQIFNLLADIIVLAWAINTSTALSGQSKYLLFSNLIALVVIFICVLITFRRKAL